MTVNHVNISKSFVADIVTQVKTIHVKGVGSPR
jgi:hypothetical protein